MNDTNIYRDISERTGGDIYIGVVGPVRTGKSTFIKQFMNTMVLPRVQDEYMKNRATDELPQSSAGKTIMTTEPKFIPEEAVQITAMDGATMNVRLIDCVGYIVPSAIGYIENDQPRMVRTPWLDMEIPFNMAAEIGTEKVIKEHSTIGMVITTDGSISDIPRSEYAEAEARVVEELKAINKPFIVLLNCVEPNSQQAQELAAELSAQYGVAVRPVNCLNLNEEAITGILSEILMQFPVKEIDVDIPRWVLNLSRDHWLKSKVMETLKNAAGSIRIIGQVEQAAPGLTECPYITRGEVTSIDLGKGCVKLSITLRAELFYKVIGESTGIEMNDESELISCILDLAAAKREYEKVKTALEEVEATGYGIVMPDMSELTLEEPEIVKQGGRYGVKLKASAPSIHMLKTNINTEVSPIVGSERQSEELVEYLLSEFEENPSKIWESNIFGKSLHELVNEGQHNKLYRMPGEARMKLQETLERIVNEGCSGLICIIL